MIVATAAFFSLYHSSAMSTENTNPVVNHPTLPRNVSYKEYSKYIADELGWMPNNETNRLCKGSYLIPHYLQKNPELDEKAPVHISAQGPEIFKLEGVSELKNHVKITQPGRIIYADKVFIFRDSTTHKIVKIELIGHVRIYQQGSLSVSDFAMLTLHPKTVEISQVAYHYYSKTSPIRTIAGQFNAWGTASHGSQSSTNVTVLHKATYSTCPPISPEWKVSARKLVLDKPNNIGKAYDAVLRVFNIPIFYSPYYSFQLNNERKSGFLMPVLGKVGDAGTYVSLPYYFNLAPNYDLLATAQLFGQRGFRGLGKFRYLTARSHGDVSASFLPDDKYFQTFRQNALNTYSNPSLYPTNVYQPYLNALQNMSNQRGEFNMNNSTIFNEHWSSRLSLNWVSDPYYIVDTSANMGNALSTTNELLNLLQFQFSNSYWDVSTSAQAYQPLFLINQVQGTGQNLAQYSRLPDFNAAGYFPISQKSDFELDTDYTDFYYGSAFAPKEPQGNRLHLRPGLLFDFENSGAYFKPQTWLDMVGYDLTSTVPGVPYTSERALPIFDIDSGLYFFHDFHFKQNSYQQTFEPRLFYLYVPYKNQNNLPNFDTIQLPFFFDQLFALNTFQGIDRLENANQVSLGFTSNTITSAGNTILSANLGQIYYIDSPQVCLTADCNLIKRNASPLVANLTYNPSPVWALSNNIAWDPKTRSTNNANTGLYYHGDGRHIIGFSYMYVGANAGSLPTFAAFQQNSVNNYTAPTSYLTTYFAWPIKYQWTILGNTFYNFNLRRIDNLYTGLQYDSCCWSIRFIFNENFNGSTLTSSNTTNNVLTLNNKYNTSFFVEFTLKGLASFGSGSDRFVQTLVPGFNNNIE